MATISPTARKLRFGPYVTPRFKLGTVVQDAARGSVIVCELKDSSIPWPLGRLQGRSSRGPILYRDLVRAVRREAASAVCYWWKVTPQTVTRWRRLLGVAPNNEGERALRAENGLHNWPKVKPKFLAKARDLERRRKISEAKTGVPRPREVIEKMRRARLGTSHSPASRKKMSDTHKRLGHRPPNGRLWTKAEDRIVSTHTAKEATAKLTGRTEAAV